MAWELFLALVGVEEGSRRVDPFAGFSRTTSLFEPARRPDGTEVYRLSPVRAREFGAKWEPEPQREFLAAPAEKTFRIFVVGGSSSAGTPYTTNYAFSAWLERRLRAALPELRLEVVNAAMPGYASRRILPIVEEIADYECDLLIAYLGHNEWAERQYYAHLINIPPTFFRLLEWVSKTRTYALMSRLVVGDEPRRPLIEEDFRTNTREMFAVLRERTKGGGYPTPRELQYRDLLYETNLRAIADAMHRGGARVMFVSLSQNFSDWPPPASRHRPGVDAGDLARWRELVATGAGQAEAGDCEGALDSYGRALRIDDAHAGLHYRIATCQRRLGDRAAAWAHYRRASDLDPVPQGAPTYFNDILHRVADDTGALWVDADSALAAESGSGLVGDDLFTDFAHPNVRAHQTIARAIAGALRDADLPVAASKWGTGYEDPDPRLLYEREPRLATQELQSRVFVCLVADRDACETEARELLDLDPDNIVARGVLGRIEGAEAR